MNAEKITKYLVLLAMLLFLGACAAPVQDQKDLPPLPPVQYPYKASPEREQTIIANMKKLTKGMPVEEVIKLMGQPDERTGIYLSEDAMSDNKPVSHCYIYLVRRNTDKGSMLERNEKLLRIYFDKNDHMIRLEKIGIK